MLTKEQTDILKKQIANRAKNLKGNPVFKNESLEDIQQELWVRMLSALEKFDPNRGVFEHFTMKVLKNQAAKMVHKQCSQKRAPFAPKIPLNEEIVGDFPKGMQEDEALNRLAFQGFLRKLPAAIRNIVEQIPEHSFREIARMTSISRPAIRKLVADLKPALAAHLGGPDFLGVLKGILKGRCRLCACR